MDRWWQGKQINNLSFCRSSNLWGGHSAAREALPRPSPALLESAACSDHVCQHPARLSSGSVLTGVSKAGAAFAARTAPGREEEQEKGPEALHSTTSAWAGGAVWWPGKEGWDSLGFLNIPQFCGPQEGLLLYA